ncbi:hypothetical protein RRG08_041023 [Elysia crispata]|uniref:Uncharacterized protein n=1 Tax=Elysia crispata TaxID=231223 RepID=A0AAE1BC57_9GAST|nr:hypothetical protein RRG08_041023 [Elysia crispata]
MRGRHRQGMEVSAKTYRSASTGHSGFPHISFTGHQLPETSIPCDPPACPGGTSQLTASGDQTSLGQRDSSVGRVLERITPSERPNQRSQYAQIRSHRAFSQATVQLSETTAYEIPLF